MALHRGYTIAVLGKGGEFCEMGVIGTLGEAKRWAKGKMEEGKGAIKNLWLTERYSDKELDFWKWSQDLNCPLHIGVPRKARRGGGGEEGTPTIKHGT